MNKALILFFTERRAIIFPHIEKIVKCKPTQPINGIHKQFLWYFKENNGKVCTDFGYTCQLIRKIVIKSFFTTLRLLENTLKRAEPPVQTPFIPSSRYVGIPSRGKSITFV